MMHKIIKDTAVPPTQTGCQDLSVKQQGQPTIDTLEELLAYHRSLPELGQGLDPTSAPLNEEEGGNLDQGRHRRDASVAEEENPATNQVPAAPDGLESTPTVPIPVSNPDQAKSSDPDDPPPQKGGEAAFQPKAEEHDQFDLTFIEVARSCIKDSFHNKHKTAYVSVEGEGGYYETLAVRSKKLESFLVGTTYARNKTLPPRSEVCKTLDILEAEALFNGPEKTLHVRVAKANDAIYIDRGDSDFMQVKITRKGRRLIHASKSPVKFIRPPRMQPMPRPVEGGSLELLRKYIPGSDPQDFVLITAWILGAFNPDGPFPLLGLVGEQGTGKTFLSGLLVDLVDPSDPATTSPPRTARDQMVAAMNGHVQCYDNLSSMPDWFSDALCRQATGVGFVTRTLHTNVDETTIKVKKPSILNGISGFLGRHDLIDRMILIVLSQIPKNKRRRELDIRREWEKDKPAILGAIFKAVSAALRNLDNLKLTDLPRMADFTHFVCAAEEALPGEPGDFMKVYNDNRKNLVDEAMENDVVGWAVKNLVEKGGEWSGKPTELLAVLNKKAPANIQKSRDWPKQPNVLSGRLRRAATFLREKNIEVGFSKSGDRNITLTYSVAATHDELGQKMAQISEMLPTHKQSAETPQTAIEGDTLSADGIEMEVAA